MSGMGMGMATNPMPGTMSNPNPGMGMGMATNPMPGTMSNPNPGMGMGLPPGFLIPF